MMFEITIIHFRDHLSASNPVIGCKIAKPNYGLITNISNAHNEYFGCIENIAINKIDLVDESGLEVVKERIKKINPFAKIINTTKCGVPLKEILNLDAFSLKRVLDVEPDFLTSDHDHEHDDDVTSLSFVSDTPLNMEKFQEWFGNLLQTKGQDILRTKGILDFKDQSDRYVFQGVHMLMDASPMGKWPEGKERSSRLVFIGRNLESMNLKEGFENCKSA